VVGKLLFINSDKLGRGDDELGAAVLRTLNGPLQPVSGPLRVAARCGATILQGFIIACEDFRYELALEPISLGDGVESDSEEAIRAALEVYARSIERFVRSHPSLMTRLGR